MSDETKFALGVIGWLLCSSIWLITAWWLIFDLGKREEGWFFLLLLVQMIISGAGLLYFIFHIAGWIDRKDVLVATGEGEEK